jgi:serine protease Do
LGITFEALDDELREKFQLPGENGFVVAEVQADGPAQKAGLQAGDLLLEINRRRITTAEELLRALDPAKPALVLVRRGPKSMFFSVEPPAPGTGPEVRQN